MGTIQHWVTVDLTLRALGFSSIFIRKCRPRPKKIDLHFCSISASYREKQTQMIFHFKFKYRMDGFLFCLTGVVNESSETGSLPDINQLWSHCRMNPEKEIEKREGVESEKLYIWERRDCDHWYFKVRNTLLFYRKWLVQREKGHLEARYVLLHSSATRLYNKVFASEEGWQHILVLSQF